LIFSRQGLRCEEPETGVDCVRSEGGEGHGWHAVGEVAC
jgi:hypothetical protein